MRHRSKRGIPAGAFRRTMAEERGIVISESTDSEMGFGALPGLIVTLKECSSAERRKFKRWLVGKGMRERVVQTFTDTRGTDIPAALEVSGLPDSLQLVLDELIAPDSIIREVSAIIDVQAPYRSDGSGELSDSARRFSRLNKWQRRARSFA